MPERKVIGIDFGSSQSSIAVLRIGSTESPELLNVGGGRNGVTIPTLLAVDANDGSVIDFGANVRKHYSEEQQGTVIFASNFKRYLGKLVATDDPSVQKEANQYCKLFICELAKFVKDRYNVKELDFNDFETCLAHPATWTKEQVELLKQYAKEAGFPADPILGIKAIPEPVAAMHALKVQNADFRFGNCPEYYMVIDFGGGTLDICVIRTDTLGRTPEIISTSGDSELGGKEFDDIIEHKFFQNVDGISKGDLSGRELAELSDKIREAKETFSENFKTNELASFSFHLATGQYSLTLSRSEFDNICKDRGIFDKIKKCIHDALGEAHLDVDKIKKVILTGGSSKWYFIRNIVAKEFALGGESIFLTENPFTDVANGCAICVGRPDAPPENKGVWVKYKLNRNDIWSEPKCILKPAKSNSLGVEERMYIGTINATQYILPYKIYLSWWTGFKEDSLEQDDKEAIIEFYARSNMPFMNKIRGIRDVISGKDFLKKKDAYDIYLKCSIGSTGNKKYSFEILDAEATQKESVMLTKGVVAAKNMPDGHKEEGDIMQGYISFRAMAGLKIRKLMPL
ncbi:MAG: Hsp70 family protein [Victivallales bacterium]|nr:Hsp70 family protein [Victivallales bacterium]